MDQSFIKINNDCLVVPRKVALIALKCFGGILDLQKHISQSVLLAPRDVLVKFMDVTFENSRVVIT